QRKQSLRETLNILFTNEIAAVLAENVVHFGVRVPAEPAPDHLVDIVVTAFRVSQEADGVGLRLAKNDRFTFRPRIDAFTRFGDGKGHVPAGHGILALPGVS